MRSKSHAAIIKIAKEEAQARGYRGQIKSYQLDMESNPRRVLVKMENGSSFDFPATRLSGDDDFQRAASETKRMRP